MKPTEEQLRACSKTELGVIATYFNRKISIKITKYIARTNITPNEITGISFLIGALSSVLFSTGEYIYLIIGAILVQASFTLDCVDGQIARLKNLQTKFGDFLDSVSDITRNVLIVFGAAVGIFSHAEDFLAQLTVFSAILGVIMMDYVGVKKKNVFGQQLDLIDERIRYKLGSATLLRYEEDTYLFLLTLGGLFNRMLNAMIIVAITTNVYWFVQLLLVHSRSSRDQNSLTLRT
jgi:phosphatidylglycerophosphate synthase